MSTSLPALLAACTAGIAAGTLATLTFSPAKSTPTPSIPSSTPTSPRKDLTLRDLGDGTIGRQSSIGPISDHLQRIAYSTAYDRRNRIPAWTAQHLTAESLKRPPPPPGSSEGDGKRGGGVDRSNSTFKEDHAIPEMFRARLLDYFKSGYDRGHMVPAADAKSSQQAMDETFILTNVAPQVGEGFNRNYWAYLEAFCRNLTNQFDDVYVFTIPLFLPKQFPDNKWRVSYEMLAPQGGAPSIAVPTHFAKVILAARSSPGSFWSKDSSAGARKEERGLEVIGNGEGREWSLGAFVLPNQVIPDQLRLETFLVPVEAVESSAGLTLLPPTIKSVARPLCATVSCELTIRRFDDAAKKSNGGKGNGKGKNGRPELTRSSTL